MNVFKCPTKLPITLFINFVFYNIIMMMLLLIYRFKHSFSYTYYC